jgi:hypothetical protein
MQDERSPDFILAGVPKAATTWIHECFREHPDIYVPESDTLNFFETTYHRGIDSYRANFAGANSDQIVGESSPASLGDPLAPQRIADHLPDVTLLFSLRNPVDRAFSQWWHGYSDRYWTYEFEEIFQQYPPYQMWVTPGFYDHYLDRFQDYFDDDQLNVFFFDDLVDDDDAFISEIFAAVGADPDFEPSTVGEKVNEAHYEGSTLLKRTRNWVQNNASATARRILSPFVSTTSAFALDRSTYEDGMGPEMREQLEQIYREDVVSLMERTDRDLSGWFEHVELPTPAAV